MNLSEFVCVSFIHSCQCGVGLTKHFVATISTTNLGQIIVWVWIWIVLDHSVVGFVVFDMLWVDIIRDKAEMTKFWIVGAD